jgi:uncharacterized alpha-E superfamily protein
MLSRHADSCYWIGRTVERAEATARMVDIHYHSGLESFLPTALGELSVEGDEVRPLPWHSVLAISGNAADYFDRHGLINDRALLYFFSFDPDNPNSILSTWKSARENARAIREEISSEMWECLNISHLRLREWDVDRVLAHGPHEFFKMVENSSHLFQGILNRTLSMGEARDWIDTGRFMERGDQTTRLLDVRYHDLLPAKTEETPTGSSELVENSLDMHNWIAVLKSVSAFEMYRKTHRSGIKPVNVVQFLALNLQFPASIRHCVERVDGCLHRISGMPRESASTEPERLIGRLRADHLYLNAAEIVAGGLHDFLSQIQARFIAIGNAISEKYLC